MLVAEDEPVVLVEGSVGGGALLGEQVELLDQLEAVALAPGGHALQEAEQEEGGLVVVGVSSHSSII